MSPAATRERTNMSKLMVERRVVVKDGCVRCEADGLWGGIEKTRREDEDERRFS